jgi:hypothetical protein
MDGEVRVAAVTGEYFPFRTLCVAGNLAGRASRTPYSCPTSSLGHITSRAPYSEVNSEALALHGVNSNENIPITCQQ